MVCKEQKESTDKFKNINGFWLFFFKQKTAYEMCGRDWSSDVCSSDLTRQVTYKTPECIMGALVLPLLPQIHSVSAADHLLPLPVI